MGWTYKGDISTAHSTTIRANNPTLRQHLSGLLHRNFGCYVSCTYESRAALGANLVLYHDEPAIGTTNLGRPSFDTVLPVDKEPYENFLRLAGERTVPRVRSREGWLSTAEVHYIAKPQPPMRSKRIAPFSRHDAFPNEIEYHLHSNHQQNLSYRFG